MRNPMLRVFCLEVRNGLRPGLHLPPARILSGAVVLAGVAGVTALLLARSAAALTDAFMAHWDVVAAVLAVQALVLVRVGRPRWTAAHAGSWLSTLPVSRGKVRMAIVLRMSCWVLLPLLLLVTVVLAAAGLAARPVSPLASALLACGVAAAFGALSGWVLAGRAMRRSRPQPLVRRYACQPGFEALSRWPAAQVRDWLPPRVVARLVLPLAVLFPVTMGSAGTGNLILEVLGLWVMVCYLAALLRATVRVIRDGADWLRPTPVDFGRFAWAAVRGSLARQFLWIVMAALVLAAMGYRPGVALRLAEGWAAIVGIVVSLALSQARRPGAFGLKLVACLCLLALIERFKHWLALPYALLVAVLVCSRMARA